MITAAADQPINHQSPSSSSTSFPIILLLPVRTKDGGGIKGAVNFPDGSILPPALFALVTSPSPPVCNPSGPAGGLGTRWSAGGTRRPGNNKLTCHKKVAGSGGARGNRRGYFGCQLCLLGHGGENV